MPPLPAEPLIAVSATGLLPILERGVLPPVESLLEPLVLPLLVIVLLLLLLRESELAYSLFLCNERTTFEDKLPLTFFLATTEPVKGRTLLPELVRVLELPNEFFPELFPEELLSVATRAAASLKRDLMTRPAVGLRDRQILE